MQIVTNSTTVTLHTGRKAQVTARTSNTNTGWIVFLTNAEAKKMRLSGYSTGRYAYSVALDGTVERWVNGYGGKIAKVAAPTLA